EKVKAHYDRAMAGEGHVAIDEYGEDQLRYYYEIRYNPIYNKENETIGVTSFAQDITERKRIEDRLQEREKSLSEAQAIAHVGSWRWEIIPDKVYWSDETYLLFGWEAGEDVSYDKYLGSVFPEDRDFVKKEVNDALDGVKLYENVHRIIRNGEVRIHHTRGKVFRDEQGKPTKMIGVVQDITERKRIENALSESEERLQAFMEAATENFGIYDSELNLIEINKAGLSMWPEGTKKGDLIGKNFAELSPNLKDTGRYNQYMKVIETGEPIYASDIVPHPMFGDINLEVRGFKVGNGFGMITTDITKRKQLEEQLRQSHKMESIGTLAGGIAHDFNNMLSIILGNAELAMDDVPEWNPARENLEEIKTGSLRAKDVVKQLLSFSRKTNPKRKPIKISPIIKDSIKFLRSSIPTSIEIHRTIPDESGIISADHTQIHQVMLNLCTNAAHAMSENGGIMEVSLSVVEIGQNKAIKDIELNQGQYVKITVSDTGHGIATEHLDKIFDPYFTTKAVGEGSGIGLSVVHGIVKSHDGAISVESEYGKGATFNVFLPVVEKEPVFEEETDTTIPTGNERILFVDDEKSIANMTSQMLELLGYTVTAKT
ncbi:MAG: PAS domain S-box protein, partial [candidate division Zixibacteria bacterium]|nr:PAS domain S-box protein [candidate division Zixibacteria bacterium]